LDDPKFKNSKFLGFMKNLNTGAMKVEKDKNELVRDEDKIMSFGDHYKEHEPAEPVLRNDWKELDGPGNEDMEKIFGKEENISDDQFDDMMKNW
jgi:hypothetical protein